MPPRPGAPLPFRPGARVRLSNGQLGRCRGTVLGGSHWEIEFERGARAIVDEYGYPDSPMIVWHVESVDDPAAMIVWHDESVDDPAADLRAREEHNRAEAERLAREREDRLNNPPQFGDRWARDGSARMSWDRKWPTQK